MTQAAVAKSELSVQAAPVAAQAPNHKEPAELPPPPAAAEPERTGAAPPSANTPATRSEPKPNNPTPPLEPQRTKAVSVARALRHASAPPAAVAPPSVVPAAPAANLSQSSADALASWKGALLAHINRFKRYPAEATGSGAATVAFVINGSGAVVSARLAKSSGDSALDEEAVGLLHRASPAPAPPTHSTLSLNLPIIFNSQ